MIGLAVLAATEPRSVAVPLASKEAKLEMRTKKVSLVADGFLTSLIKAVTIVFAPGVTVPPGVRVR